MSKELISFLPPEDLEPEYVFGGLSETMDWGLLWAGIPEAHKYTKGTGITVAVLDTGYAPHTDLEENILSGINCSANPSTFDRQGHGTHVAGIVAASANGIGVVGVAPEAKIVPIKVLNDDGRANFFQIGAGLRAAIDAGVDIINMSLGSPAEPPASIHRLIKEATDKGIIVIAAAGNDGGQVNYPARYDEVIAVAAIDHNGDMARFSSRGDQIDVGAPGVGIYSTYCDNQYAILQGTSQAAPFVAGVCALILSWYRANPDKGVVGNYVDMLRELDKVSDPQGRLGLGFGIPNFANIDPASL